MKVKIKEKFNWNSDKKKQVMELYFFSVPQSLASMTFYSIYLLQFEDFNITSSYPALVLFEQRNCSVI